MKKRIFLLLMLFVTYHCHASERIKLVRHPNITSATNGLVLTEIYRKAGLELTIVTMPGVRGSIEAAAGRVDGEVNRIAEYAALHPSLIRVEPPIYEWGVSAFYKKSRNITLQSAADLKNYKLGYVRGVVAAENLLKKFSNVQQANDTTSLLKMLQQDRFDIVVDGTNEFNFYLSTSERSKISQIQLIQHPLYHYLHESKQDLVPVLSKIIRSLRDSGELTLMYQKAEKELLRDGVDPLK